MFNSSVLIKLPAIEKTLMGRRAKNSLHPKWALDLKLDPAEQKAYALDPFQVICRAAMADRELWARYFPTFAKSEESAVIELMGAAKTLKIPAGTTLFEPGGSCQHYLLVLEGVAKVQILTPGGRELLLYKVNSGNPCTMTTSCLLGASDYPAFGVAETDMTAFAIPSEAFNQALNQSTFFREFVFKGFSSQIARIIGRMEEWVEGDIDQMLARTLLQSATVNQVSKTHQELAIAIGSAREVVSRHLKRFEQQGWIRLGRGQLEILNREPLIQIAGALNEFGTKTN